MNPVATVLILSSTFMHAGWNLLARRGRSEAAFIWRMLLAVVLVGLVPAAISEALTRSLTPKAWACVLASGCFCGAYYFFLARGYRASDFTIVYPVVRALPVLLVAVGDVFRGRYPTLAGWLGMVLVASGCFLMPLRRFGDLAARHYLNRAGIWMLLTALATVGYTLLDKIGAEVARQGPATAARYCYIFHVVSFLTYGCLLRVFEKRALHLSLVGWKAPAIAGCCGFGAYWLVVWAYQLAARAGYIVAFRQFSIIIGVVLAFAIFKEKGLAVRLTGALLTVLGLIVIALWGGS